MIKIKHKLNHEIQEIPVYGWDQNLHHNHETWEVIAEYNLVRLKQWLPKEKKWILRHRMEKDDAKKLVEEHPNDYLFDDLPDTGNLFPIKKPKIYTVIIKAVKNIIKFISNNPLISTFIGGLLVLIIWFFVHQILKQHYGHD